jgi:hypothetical protein
MSPSRHRGRDPGRRRRQPARLRRACSPTALSRSPVILGFSRTAGLRQADDRRAGPALPSPARPDRHRCRSSPALRRRCRMLRDAAPGLGRLSLSTELSTTRAPPADALDQRRQAVSHPVARGAAHGARHRHRRGLRRHRGGGLCRGGCGWAISPSPHLGRRPVALLQRGPTRLLVPARTCSGPATSPTGRPHRRPHRPHRHLGERPARPPPRRSATTYPACRPRAGDRADPDRRPISPAPTGCRVSRSSGFLLIGVLLVLIVLRSARSPACSPSGDCARRRHGLLLVDVRHQRHDDRSELPAGRADAALSGADLLPLPHHRPGEEADPPRLRLLRRAHAAHRDRKERRPAEARRRDARGHRDVLRHARLHPLSESACTPPQILALLNTLFGALGRRNHRSPGHHRQVHRRCHHGVLERAGRCAEHPRRAAEAALGMRNRRKALNAATPSGSAAGNRGGIARW